MRLQVYHRTEYLYPEAVSDSRNELRLTPKSTPRQEVESSLIYVLPATKLSSYKDLNYNRVHHFTIPNPHQRLLIESRFTVRTQQQVDMAALPYGFLLEDLPSCSQSEECHPFLQGSAYIEITPEIWREAIDIRGDARDVFQISYAIMEHIYMNYDYVAGATNAMTHANEAIRKRTGVCQDFAHAMVALCRSLKIPARYVSGYFYDSTRNHSLRGSEASHAWVEVYTGAAGWVGLDPTNRKVIDNTYIILAIGRDYRDVAPVIGSYYGRGGSALNIHVQVQRLKDNA